MKAIRISPHAEDASYRRGASTDEIVTAIRESPWLPAKRGRLSATQTYPFDSISPVNRMHYRWKTVEAVFVEEDLEIVVVTVKVYYGEEVSQ
jgi:hypothetical protein